MKALFISRWYPCVADPQLGVFVKKHAKAVSLFAETYVIAAFPDENISEKFRIEAISEGNYNHILVYYRKAHRICNMIRYYRALGKAVARVKKDSGKPDIIHAHVLLRPFVFAYLLSICWHRPYFISDHWTGYIYGGFRSKSLLYRMLTRFFVRHAAAVSLVSPSLKSAFESSGIKNRDIRIIPNVVGYPDKQHNHDHGGLLQILTVADLADSNKNISGTLETLDKIFGKLPDFQFHIVGGGPDEVLLMQKTENLKNISGKVFFHGRVPNDKVFDFLANADFLIVNSRVETFSVITAEALACGVPVIATICGGPEFIVNGGNGILIPPENPEALENAIVEMSARYDSYDKNIMRKDIDEKFSASAISGQFKLLYSDHLNSR